MTTKAIIVAKDMDGAKYQVRIPTIDGIKNSKVSPVDDEYLSWASVAYTPGINVEYQPGDIVWVAFEDNEIDQPVILGHVKLKGKDLNSKVYIDAQNLTVEGKFEASLDSVYGDTDYSEIFDMVDRCQRCPFYFREGEYYTVNFWTHPAPYSEEEEPYATVYVPANNQSRVKVQDIPDDPPILMFNGWYYKDTFDHDLLWDFNDCVLGDLDLYALDYYTVNFWTHEPPFSASETPYATVYVLADGLSRIETQDIPSNPSVLIFNGWYYKDTFNHSRLWNFNDCVLEDLDLYAPGYYTVTFMSGIQDNAIPLCYSYVLADDFHRSGYVLVVGDVKEFDGWYYKDPFGHYLLWDFDKFVLRDTEFYIFWKDGGEYNVNDSSLLIFDLILDDGYSLWKIAFVCKDEPLSLDELFGIPDSTKSSGTYVVFRGWRDRIHGIEGIRGEWTFSADIYTTRDNTLYAEYVDYEDLYYAVAIARATGQNGYSDEAWAEFREALDVAIEARDQAREGNLSQSEIDAATAAINEALEKLKSSLN